MSRVIEMRQNPETMTRAVYGQILNKRAEFRELQERYDYRAIKQAESEAQRG